MQVENLGLFATPFGQALRTLASDLRFFFPNIFPYFRNRPCRSFRLNPGIYIKARHFKVFRAGRKITNKIKLFINIVHFLLVRDYCAESLVLRSAILLQPCTTHLQAHVSYSAVGTWPINGGRKIARKTMRKNGLLVFGLKNCLAW